MLLHVRLLPFLNDGSRIRHRLFNLLGEKLDVIAENFGGFPFLVTIDILLL